MKGKRIIEAIEMFDLEDKEIEEIERYLDENDRPCLQLTTQLSEEYFEEDDTCKYTDLVIMIADGEITSSVNVWVG